MNILRIYVRVLAMLASEKRLAIILIIANLALAVAAFAEPILFGRIIDTLTRSAGDPSSVSWAELLPLIYAWIAFGIFTILASVFVALNADRVSHRGRLRGMSDFFEHVLHLPAEADEVVAFQRQHVDRRAMVVEDRRAGIGFECAQQDLRERGLAAAAFADQS